MAASCDKDVIVWAEEQSRLLRTGQFDLLDVEHLADEIEDLGRSETGLDTFPETCPWPFGDVLHSDWLPA